MNFNTLLFRCSSLGDLMTEAKSVEDKKAGKLGATCTSKLKQIYREVRWNRKHELSNKYVEKGIACEDDAITLLSRIKKTFFKKNTERITNDFLSGEPDLFIGESILNAEEGYDTKASWSWQTFPFPDDKLEKDYHWQNHGYMALTGAKKWTTAFCLVNTPANLIDDEKKRFLYKNNLSEFDERYIEQARIIERNSIYDMAAFRKDNPNYDLASDLSQWNYDIPMKERLIEFTTYRNEETIESIYRGVIRWRLHLRVMDETFNPHPSTVYA